MRLPLALSASTVLAVSLAATLSWAGTVPELGALNDNPDSYQSQVVRVTGVVVNHRIRRGMMNKCFQSFTLEDDTGSIDVEYKASCSGARNAIRDRDVVTVEGRFELTSGSSGVIKVKSILSKVAPSAQ
jgi:cytochrome c-type biogenesis protein CcmE